MKPQKMRIVFRFIPKQNYSVDKLKQQVCVMIKKKELMQEQISEKPKYQHGVKNNVYNK